MEAYGTNLALLKRGWEPTSTRNTAPCFYKIAGKDCKQYICCQSSLMLRTAQQAWSTLPLQLGVANSLPGFSNSLPHPISQPQKWGLPEHNLTMEVNNFFPSHCFLKLDSYITLALATMSQVCAGLNS